MGALLSLFRAKKPAPTDYAQILEKISAEIEENKKKKDEFIAGHRGAISKLLIGFCLVELLLVVWYYFHQKPSEIWDHALHLLPLFLVPVLVFQVKKLISFYYNKRIERCDEVIQELIEQQQEKVAELKRITNFDVVSTLLNRYDPSTKRRPEQTQQPKPTPRQQPQPQPKPTPRQQPAPQPIHTPQPQPSVPRPCVAPSPVAPTPSRVPQTPQQTPTYVMPVPKLHNPTPLPPTPAVGQRRGFMDKLVDFLVGDGPEYSVVVTCKACGAYYANLPKEELPFTRFTCHNCGRYNEEQQQSSGKDDRASDREKEIDSEKEGKETAKEETNEKEKEDESAKCVAENEALTEDAVTKSSGEAEEQVGKEEFPEGESERTIED